MTTSKKKHVFILGAAGMLGHKLYQVHKNRFRVWATVRSSYTNYAEYGIFDSNDIIDDVDVNNFDRIVDILAGLRPDVVINCIGIIKQLKAAKDSIDKYTLLCLVHDAFGIQIEIEPEINTVIDRSLNSRRFRSETGFKPASWPEMIKQMAQDPTPYDKFPEYR